MRNQTSNKTLQWYMYLSQRACVRPPKTYLHMLLCNVPLRTLKVWSDDLDEHKPCLRRLADSQWTVPRLAPIPRWEGQASCGPQPWTQRPWTSGMTRTLLALCGLWNSSCHSTESKPIHFMGEVKQERPAAWGLCKVLELQVFMKHRKKKKNWVGGTKKAATWEQALQCQVSEKEEQTTTTKKEGREGERQRNCWQKRKCNGTSEEKMLLPSVIIFTQLFTVPCKWPSYQRLPFLGLHFVGVRWSLIGRAMNGQKSSPPLFGQNPQSSHFPGTVHHFHLLELIYTTLTRWYWWQQLHRHSAPHSPVGVSGNVFIDTLHTNLQPGAAVLQHITATTNTLVQPYFSI